MRVTNYAKFSCTIEKGQEILLRHLPDVNQYHYIDSEFGGNDATYDLACHSHRARTVRMNPHTPLDRFTDIYRDMLRAIGNTVEPPSCFRSPPH